MEWALRPCQRGMLQEVLHSLLSVALPTRWHLGSAANWPTPSSRLLVLLPMPARCVGQPSRPTLRSRTSLLLVLASSSSFSASRHVRRSGHPGSPLRLPQALLARSWDLRPQRRMEPASRCSAPRPDSSSDVQGRPRRLRQHARSAVLAGSSGATRPGEVSAVGRVQRAGGVKVGWNPRARSGNTVQRGSLHDDIGRPHL